MGGKGRGWTPVWEMDEMLRMFPCGQKISSWEGIVYLGIEFETIGRELWSGQAITEDTNDC